MELSCGIYAIWAEMEVASPDAAAGPALDCCVEVLGNAAETRIQDVVRY